MTPRLHLDGLTWTAHGRIVLSAVTFDVHAGEFVAVMGRNGAGKTTLLDIVAGLREAHEGQVWLNARPLAAWAPTARARVMAHLPQAIRPDLPFSAGELVLMGRYPHADRWFESDDDRAAVERAMRRTGCWGLRDRAVATLSGGERQRVCLAACMAQEADVLLFDEPSTYLDIDQQLQCFSLLRADCEAGAACLAVTHDLNLALRYATRVIVLADGRLALDRPVDQAAANGEWLSLFSSRLALTTTPAGGVWVSYT